MQLSEAGIQLIAKFEGTVLHLYEDPSSNATIGIGHLVHLGPINGNEPQAFKDGITQAQAYDLLRTDAQKAADCVASHVTVPLSQPQSDALISFVYNVGCGAFASSDLLTLLNQGKYSDVPAQLMRWVHGNGVVLPGLVARREAEGVLFAASQPSQGGATIALNQHGEVTDILDVNQFIPGRSAYECVAYSAALIKYGGQPGHGPTGSALQASNLAQFWYGKEEGNNLASNTNGMSLEAEYNMLDGMGMHYQASLPTIQSVKAWLAVGYPLIICGAETGMHDMALGDAVPYSWTPSGNHAIVASGIAHDGNLLVHDCANIAPNGVRTGPRTYDASKLQLVSATAIAVPWMPPIPSDPTHMEVNVIIDLGTPHMSDYFTLVNGNQWQRKNTPGGKTIIILGDMLKYYQTNGCVPYCGFSSAGLPLSNEIKIEQFGPDFAKLAGSGITVQYFERAVWIYDKNHIIDHPLDAGTVYPLHLYQMPGQDPEVTKLLSQVANMQAQLATQQATITAQEAQIAQLQQPPTNSPDPIAAIHAVQAAVAPFK